MYVLREIDSCFNNDYLIEYIIAIYDTFNASEVFNFQSKFHCEKNYLI